ncbi:LysR family transcriptional regulator [Mesorhizobium sp. M0913]|uniref:LysR family transcriptional regulator n=1 Tax=Mesorhizobium sp. M0913 TaxID=2957026 RepID=UPI0033385AEE
MRMKDWDDFKTVLAVLRSGSIGGAARVLRSTQPTVSRRLHDLEKRLGFCLFERDVDGARPTPVCQSLQAYLERMENAALHVERRLASSGDGLQGSITVTSLDWVANWILAPILAEFGRQHSDLELKLITTDQLLNLSRGEADIAFHFLPFKEQDILMRKVVDVRYGFYCSEHYLATHGPVDGPHGGLGHFLVGFNDPTDILSNSVRSVMPKSNVILTTNNITSQLNAAESGTAIAVLPCALADGRGSLVALQLGTRALVVPLKLGMHSQLRNVPRIRAFMDFVIPAVRRRLGPPMGRRHEKDGS